MDDDQQFCLRWNNHQSTLISVFDALLEREVLVDCTLAAEGKFLKAHKVVLSACSPYFAALLEEQYDKHPIFILKDVKYQELRAMMDYMYRGEVNISQDQLAALLKAAESLQIKGLSDNRSGGAPRPDHQRGLSVPSGNAGGVGKLSSGYTLEQTKRARIGPSPMDTQDMSASREGSSSPSRRRRKVRRRSNENVMVADVHDNSNSSQIQATQQSLLHQQQQQSNANLTGVGAITAAASALASQIPVSPASLPGGSTAIAATVAGSATATPGTSQQMTTSVTKKTESVKGTSDAMNTDTMQAAGAVAGADEQELLEHVAAASNVEKQNHKQKSGPGSSAAGKETSSSELVIEPKSEYDEEGNDEPVEDLTLDDEDMGMDDLDHNAGTSQGGEGSSQGYAPWQHDRSQDELLLATQEAQQRDPQADLKYEFQSSMIISDSFARHERFPCAVCGKSYLRKRHLQRHMRDECIGIPPRFSCHLCPSRFRRKYHMVRHLTSKHGIPPDEAQKMSGSGMRSSGGVGATGDVNLKFERTGADSMSELDGCESPIPENLSLPKKEHYEHENVPSPSGVGLLVGGGGAGTGTGAGGGAGIGMAKQGIISNGNHSPIPPLGMLPVMPTYGFTGAITAITNAAAVVEAQSAANGIQGTAGVGGSVVLEQAAAAMDAIGASGVGGAGGVGAGGSDGGGVGVAIKTEQLTPQKTVLNNMMDEDWRMKLSLQVLSSSLLKERLMNFAYNNNN